MNPTKIGQLICALRKERHLTQLQLARMLHISDKTVSKWECGLGCPDVSLLTALAELFQLDLNTLLKGELDPNSILGGNMKKIQFYLCPDCGNLITAMTDTAVSCCGKRLTALQPQEPGEEERLCVQPVETELYLTSSHPMTKDHYISFVALLSGDSLVLRKLYPEWGLQVRLPALPRAKVLWCCSQHGLFVQGV